VTTVVTEPTQTPEWHAAHPDRWTAGTDPLLTDALTAYAFDDVGGDTEPEQADRTALGRVRWLISTEHRDRNDVGEP